MANYKAVDVDQLESDLGIVCDAIREKGGTSEPLAFPNGMADAVRGIQSGGSGDDKWGYVQNLAYMFNRAVFPSGYVLEVNAPMENPEPNYCLMYAFANTTVDKIVLKGNVNSVLVESHNTFQSTIAKEIDLSGFNYTIKSLSNTFTYSKVKKIIGVLDLSNCTKIRKPFDYCADLVDICFKTETIPLSISFASCRSLSDASIQSIIDGLADLTGQTAQTVTFHADVKAKLTDEQKTQITSKNWILA